MFLVNSITLSKQTKHLTWLELAKILDGRHADMQKRNGSEMVLYSQMHTQAK